MPPTGIPTYFRSLPRSTSGVPRAKSDFTQSGESFLSAGTRRSKSSRVNGPAMIGRRENASPRTVAAEVLRKSRRAHWLAGKLDWLFMSQIHGRGNRCVFSPELVGASTPSDTGCQNDPFFKKRDSRYHPFHPSVKRKSRKLKPAGASQFLNSLENGLGSSRRDRLIIARSFNCG